MPFPKIPELNTTSAARLIVELKDSEVEKTRCGRRLIAWIENLAKGLK